MAAAAVRRIPSSHSFPKNIDICHSSDSDSDRNV